MTFGEKEEGTPTLGAFAKVGIGQNPTRSSVRSSLKSESVSPLAKDKTSSDGQSDKQIGASMISGHDDTINFTLSS